MSCDQHFFAFFKHKNEQLFCYPKVIQSYPKVARKWITQKLLTSTDLQKMQKMQKIAKFTKIYKKMI